MKLNCTSEGIWR